MTDVWGKAVKLYYSQEDFGIYRSSGKHLDLRKRAFNFWAKKRKSLQPVSRLL